MRNSFTKNLRLLFVAGNHLHKNEDGQIIVFTALAGLALVMMVTTIFNVGMVIGEKMKVQDAADDAAYSQAVLEARALNLLAYTNRAIISHMVTIAFTTAILSQEELWYQINDVASVLAAIPYIGPVIKTGAQIMWLIMRALAAIARPMREAARLWIIACQNLFQNPMMAELAVQHLARDRIANKIARGVDPAIKINKAGSMIGGVAINAANAMSLAKLTGKSPSVIEFNHLKNFYVASMDSFSKGTSLPRRVAISNKPLLEIGLEGKLEISRNRITQKDGAVFKGLWVSLFFGGGKWLVNKHFTVADQVYHGLQLGHTKMWNAQRGNAEDLSPSVYVLAQKSSEDILQIPLLDSGTDKTITALSRAQVFYWDPDRGRSQRLRSFTPSREPNLFNPFWHARLAPLDQPFGFTNTRLP